MRCPQWERRLSISAALIASVVFVAFGQGKTAWKTVQALELQRGTQIIGLLGVPLGELVSIRGEIVDSNTKGGDKLVDIVEVDGKALSGTLQMRYSVWEWGNIGLKSLPEGQRLKLRVYETGGMIGIPFEAMRETTFVQTEGWGFATSLVLLNRE
jgi:hypothetical protein